MEAPKTVSEGIEGLEVRLRDLGQFIRDQRRVASMSLRSLSERAGVSNPYLSQIERGLRRPSADILQRLAKALRVSAETLYVRAGILEDLDDEPDVEGALRRDPTITERHKQTLLDIYRSFQREKAGDGDGHDARRRSAG